jgi:F-type H+-transporting ATPase subunit delta
MKDVRTLNDIATALVSMAAEKRVLTEILNDIRKLEETFHTHSELISDLALPGTPLRKRLDALSHALEKQIHPFLKNALLLLLEKNLLSELPAFADAVRKSSVEQGSREATVTTAIELTEKERKKLAELLQKKFDAEITLREIQDPTLLGGMIITMGDWRFDGSVKGRIDRLTHELYV